MADRRPLNELIDKALDQAATDAELAELERQLSDPASLRAYVAGLRMHVRLETLLQEEAAISARQATLRPFGRTPGRRHPAGLRWVVIAACVLGVATGLWWTLARVPSPLPLQVASPRVVPSPALGTGSEWTGTDDMSAEEAMSLFGLVTASAVK